MPVTLTTLFCAPQDVWDLLSVIGVDLRLDDDNLATGQTVTTTAGAAAGATSIAVAALAAPLLSGSQLVFTSDNELATATLTAPAAAGATTVAVSALAVAISGGAQARDSGVNALTGARLVVGTRKGTSKVKLYCNARYDDSELALSGTVCDWTALCAARFLCTRRAQGCPKSLQADYDEAIEEMRMVQAGQLQIEDIGTRGADWPTVTNITVNPGYDGMRSRVQDFISEGTPTQYNRFVDWNSALRLNI